MIARILLCAYIFVAVITSTPVVQGIPVQQCPCQHNAYPNLPVDIPVYFQQPANNINPCCQICTPQNQLTSNIQPTQSETEIKNQINELIINKILSNPAFQSILNTNTKILDQNGVDILRQVPNGVVPNIVNNYIILPQEYFQSDKIDAKRKDVVVKPAEIENKKITEKYIEDKIGTDWPDDPNNIYMQTICNHDEPVVQPVRRNCVENERSYQECRKTNRGQNSRNRNMNRKDKKQNIRLTIKPENEGISLQVKDNNKNIIQNNRNSSEITKVNVRDNKDNIGSSKYFQNMRPFPNKVEDHSKEIKTKSSTDNKIDQVQNTPVESIITGEVRENSISDKCANTATLDDFEESIEIYNDEDSQSDSALSRNTREEGVIKQIRRKFPAIPENVVRNLMSHIKHRMKKQQFNQPNSYKSNNKRPLPYNKMYRLKFYNVGRNNTNTVRGRPRGNRPRGNRPRGRRPLTPNRRTRKRKGQRSKISPNRWDRTKKLTPTIETSKHVVAAKELTPIVDDTTAEQTPSVIESPKNFVTIKELDPTFIEIPENVITDKERTPIVVETSKNVVTGKERTPTIVDASKNLVTDKERTPTALETLKNVVTDKDGTLTVVETLKKVVTDKEGTPTVVEIPKNVVTDKEETPTFVEIPKDVTTGKLRTPTVVETPKKTVTDKEWTPAVVEDPINFVTIKEMAPTLIEIPESAVIDKEVTPTVVQTPKKVVTTKELAPTFIKIPENINIDKELIPTVVETPKNVVTDKVRTPTVVETQKNIVTDKERAPTAVETEKNVVTDKERTPKVVETQKNVVTDKERTPTVVKVPKKVVTDKEWTPAVVEDPVNFVTIKELAPTLIEIPENVVIDKEVTPTVVENSRNVLNSVQEESKSELPKQSHLEFPQELYFENEAGEHDTENKEQILCLNDVEENEEDMIEDTDPKFNINEFPELGTEDEVPVFYGNGIIEDYYPIFVDNYEDIVRNNEDFWHDLQDDRYHYTIDENNDMQELNRERRRDNFKEDYIYSYKQPRFLNLKDCKDHFYKYFYKTNARIRACDQNEPEDFTYKENNEKIEKKDDQKAKKRVRNEIQSRNPFILENPDFRTKQISKEQIKTETDFYKHDQNEVFDEMYIKNDIEEISTYSNKKTPFYYFFKPIKEIEHEKPYKNIEINDVETTYAKSKVVKYGQASDFEEASSNSILSFALPEDHEFEQSTMNDDIIIIVAQSLGYPEYLHYPP